MTCNPTSYFPDKIDEMVFFQDINLENYKILETYESLISSGNFDEANEFIGQQSSLYGYFADFFNAIENRIYNCQNYLLNKEKIRPVSFSETEPTTLENGMIWV